ncbi:MAG: Redox-sensitive transcriptional regulator (AT-rich DNA-binding protein) [Brockia lithotrophica]|uniref:Redox-sensing transcriptional repressor Rex n=1 Tax=Brockia lithotrophica TaxID=933949 RepID=A0A2T5G4M6_9BACL|nr:redox-sensing transcriptional repressor Rex [Brockia lithotrophica]PTQ51142.1 MAG: Redox-sensitive transcriptional regulator (AT-rich DNA-binding protein) [Brockia lithotrophica]
MAHGEVPEAVVRRLPLYLRYLRMLERQGIRTVSSFQMGEDLLLNPAQIRKDLAFFGEFGRKGIGYDVPYLIEKIRHILHLDRCVPIALVGAGNLGTALARYNAFQESHMRITAVFDRDPRKVGQRLTEDLVVYGMDELDRVVREQGIRVGIIAVPRESAQEVLEHMVQAGIRAVLNFAPQILKAPPGVRVHYADITAELATLAYYLHCSPGSPALPSEAAASSPSDAPALGVASVPASPENARPASETPLPHLRPSEEG